MMTSLYNLNVCGTCNTALSPQDFQPLENSKVINTACSHLFHLHCLSNWLIISSWFHQGSCPTCRGLIHLHQVGKNISVFGKMFHQALQPVPDSSSPHAQDAQLVFQTLSESDHQNTVCSTCIQELPVIPVHFDSQQQRLYHSKCAKTGSAITLTELVKVTHKLAQQHSEIKACFNGRGASLLEILQVILIKYPKLSIAIPGGLMSLSAFLLNRYRYGGKSWFLSTLSLPAYLALVITHQIGIIMIVVLQESNPGRHQEVV